MTAKNGKAPVPWKKLNKDPRPFIDDEYLPDGFTFDDPMHIPKPDLLEVFSHWEDRLAAGKTVFRFKGVSHDHRGTERPDVYQRLSSLEAGLEMSTNRLTPGVDDRASDEDDEAEKDPVDSEAEQDRGGGSGNIGRIRNSKVRSGHEPSRHSTARDKVNVKKVSSQSVIRNQQASSSGLAHHERPATGSSRSHQNNHADSQRIGLGDIHRISHTDGQWNRQGASQRNAIADNETQSSQKGTSQTIGIASTKIFPGHNTSDRQLSINRHNSSGSSHTRRDDNGVDEDDEHHPVTVQFHSSVKNWSLMTSITA